MIAVILARGGSKALPNKNIKILGDKNMSHYAIDALMKSSIESKIIYSSDNQNYLSLAKKFVETSFKEKISDFILHERSTEMAGDHVSSWDSVAQIINDLNVKSEESVLLVSGVCPAINSDDINRFIEKAKKARSALSVRLNDYPVESTFCINEKGYVEPHELTSKISARQLAKTIYRPDGHLYFRIAEDIKNSSSFPDHDTFSINLNKSHYINIDTPEDFEYAKYIMEYSID